MSNNRLWNCQNPNQGSFSRVLCVCSAGLLRSPTVAWILSNAPFNFNTRAVGTSHSHALVPVDRVHVKWADIIVCVEPEVEFELSQLPVDLEGKRVIALSLPDMYEYRDPVLVEIATEQLIRAFEMEPMENDNV